MSEQYGRFAKCVMRLEEGLSNVKSSWRDQTASTFDSFNENMQSFTKRISDHYDNARNNCDSVKRNYNEDDFEETLNVLRAKISAV